jgi:hypothetical protein
MILSSFSPAITASMWSSSGSIASGDWPASGELRSRSAQFVGGGVRIWVGATTKRHIDHYDSGEDDRTVMPSAPQLSSPASSARIKLLDFILAPDTSHVLPSLFWNWHNHGTIHAITNT